VIGDLRGDADGDADGDAEIFASPDDGRDNRK